MTEQDFIRDIINTKDEVHRGALLGLLVNVYSL
jgi:hypothetical protein